MNTKTKRLPHKKHFYGRVAKNVLAALGVLIFSLAIGVCGYSYFFNLGFEDALLNASMILAGMGPVDRAETDGAKLFASFYAIYSGIAFLSGVAVIFAPVIHRFLHKFRLDVEE